MNTHKDRKLTQKHRLIDLRMANNTKIHWWQHKHEYEYRSVKKDGQNSIQTQYWDIRRDQPNNFMAAKIFEVHETKTTTKERIQISRKYVRECG